MGVKLIVEVLDHAPAELTWRERYILVVIAETANDTTRECWPGYDGKSEASDAFRKRVNCGRSQFYAALKSLTDHKVIEVTQRGQKYQRAHYYIAPLRPTPHLDLWGDGDSDPQGPESPDAEPQGPGTSDTEGQGAPVQGPENPDAEDPDPEVQGPGSESQCPGFQASVSGFRALSVLETRTPSPQSPQVPSSSPHGAAPDDGEADGSLFPPPADTAEPRGAKSAAKEKPSKHETADALAAAFWDHHKTNTAQPFLAVRTIIRTALSNGLDRDDIARALDHLAREGRAISGGSLTIAYNQIRAARDPTAPGSRPRADDLGGDEHMQRFLARQAARRAAE